MALRRGLGLLAAAAWAGVSLTPVTARADARDAVIDALVQCANLHDPAARLACFDHNTPQLRAAAGKSPETAAATRKAPAAPPKAVALSAPPAVPQPASAPTQSEGGHSWFASLDPFGATPKPTARQMAYQPMGQEILPVTIAVQDFFVPANGAFTVTLANGQIWRAAHGYSTPPRFREGKTNLVTIDHGMLGGYDLSLYGSATLYKVKRLK